MIKVLLQNQWRLNKDLGGLHIDVCNIGVWYRNRNLVFTMVVFNFRLFMNIGSELE